MKDDGKTCVDIDECSSGFPCSQRCINTYGTYKCLCEDGYEVQPNNKNGCKSLSGITIYLIFRNTKYLGTDPAEQSSIESDGIAMGRGQERVALSNNSTQVT